MPKMQRTRYVRKMTEEMKAELRLQNERTKLALKLKDYRAKDPQRNRDLKRQTWILPEDFTGRDLKRALKLIAQKR